MYFMMSLCIIIDPYSEANDIVHSWKVGSSSIIVSKRKSIFVICVQIPVCKSHRIDFYYCL